MEEEVVEVPRSRNRGDLELRKQTISIKIISDLIAAF